MVDEVFYTESYSAHFIRLKNLRLTLRAKKFCAALRYQNCPRLHRMVIHTLSTETAMTGYVLFMLFWAVFAVAYFTRDPSLDAEKLRQCDLW